MTSSYSTTMPIIRYAIGDRGLAPNDLAACSCGHNGQTHLSLVGLDDDLVVLPGGRVASRRLIDNLFSDAFRGGLGIED